MAIQKFPAKSVANMIRKTALGVNQGGAKNRLMPAHKGVGLNLNSGGLNSRGSGAAPGPVTRPKPSASAVPTRGFGNAPAPMGGETLKVPKMTPQGYRLVDVPVTSMTAPALSAARGNAYNQHAPAAPKPGVPDGGFAGPGGAPSGLDYTSLQSYQNGMRDINDQYGAQEDDLSSQLADNPRLYSNAVADDHLAAQRDADASANQMSQMGLLRSGTREMADADRVKMYSDHMDQIEGQYGASASAKIQAALEHLHGQQKRDQEGLDSSARDEWSQSHPSNPIGEDVAAGAESVGSVAAKAPKYHAPAGKALVQYAPGKYHLAPIVGSAVRAGASPGGGSPRPLPKPGGSGGFVPKPAGAIARMPSRAPAVLPKPRPVGRRF